MPRAYVGLVPSLSSEYRLWFPYLDFSTYLLPLLCQTQHHMYDFWSKYPCLFLHSPSNMYWVTLYSRHYTEPLGAAEQCPELFLRGTMDPFLKPVTVQWGRQTSQQSVAGAYKNTDGGKCECSGDLGEGRASLCARWEIPQKGHYLKRIFKKQKFTRQMREGKTDLNLSLRIFYLLACRVGRSWWLVCTSGFNRYKVCMIIAHICEERSIGQAEFWVFTWFI